MGGSSPAPAATTQSQTTSTLPWQGARKYLSNKESTYDPTTGMYTGNEGADLPVGLFQQLSNYLNQYGELSPEQQALMGGQQSTLGDRSGQLTDLYGQNTGLANQIGGGEYNANFSGVGDVNQRGAMSQLGALDPSQAYQQLLSGTPNNPYLQQMHQANINTSMRGYDDATQNFMQQVLPSIDNAAFASGGYGGSRQGIAQGLGMQQMERNARDLGIAAMDSGNQLYGGAYENAQGRMAGAADTLGGQSLQNSQFNANLGLQNNQQLMDMLGFNMNNALQGNQLANNAFNQYASGQDQTFNQLQALLQAPQDQQQNALQFFLSGVSPGAGMGGTSTSSSSMPIYNNTLGQVLGGASGLAGLMGSFSG